MTTDSRISDQQIAKTMPLPIALAWHRVTLATGPEARVQHAVAAFEVALRTVVAMVLPDYLRSTPSERVESELDKLTRPSLGTWLGLARELVRTVGQREIAAFVEPAYDTWFERGKPGPALRSADEVVALRNKLQHGRASSGSQAWDGHARDLVARVRQLLASLVWMESYRLLRVVAQEPTRRGTQRVQVQIFAGNQPLPQPVQAELDVPLFPGAVYLLAPDGQTLIEVSPLCIVGPAEGLGEDRLHLFRSVHRKGAFEVAWDESGSVLRRRADTGDGTATFPEWLQARGSRDPLLRTSDHLGTLAAPVRRVERRQGLLAGRFELLGTLGEGGMAVVHRARDELTGEEVALKVLKTELRDDAELRARFLREAATMRRAHSPRVIASVELGELDDGELYLRMPLFEGGTVRDRLEAGPIDSETARQWAEDLLEALAHLQSLDIVHRDVKPSNLLIDAEGRLVLGDFGVALTSGEARLTRTMQHLGSLAYMAPEHRGDGQVTPAADVYSAALVLHEVCTGEAPGSRPGVGVPGAVGEVIRSMGVLDVEERATAASALAHLQNPLAGALNLPLPSDDGRIAMVALGITLAGWALAWGASRVLHPVEITGEWIPLSGVLLALLIGPGLAAGLATHRVGRAPPTRMGAWCGAWSTLGVWILGAGPFAQISGLMDWLEAVQMGGKGLTQMDYGLRLAEPILFWVLLEYALQPVVLLVGALIGGLTATMLQRQFPRDVTATQLNPFLLETTALTPACFGAFVVGFAAWVVPWIGRMLDRLYAEDSPLIAALVFVILVLPWIIAIGVGVAQLVAWHGLALAYRRRLAEGARGLALANCVAGSLLLTLPMGCAAWMVSTALSFPGRPGLVGVLLGVAVGGAAWMVWQIRRLRTPPELRITPFDHWFGSLAGVALAVVQLVGPLQALVGFFSVVIWGIRTSEYGLPIDLAQLVWLVERSWLVLALVVPFALAVGAWGGGLGAFFFAWRNARERRDRVVVVAYSALMFGGGLAVLALEVPLLQSVFAGDPDPGVLWPNPLPPGEEDRDEPRLKDVYRGGASGLMKGLAASRGRVALERDASWLEASVALALLREEDGVPAELAWADARALADGATLLDEVVRAWPDSDDLLHDAAVYDDPLLQLLHATLVARGQVDDDHAERFPATFEVLFALGRRLSGTYLLQLRAVTGSGIPDPAELVAGDAVARDAIAWKGELDDALLAERVRISLRANDERMARELLAGLDEARGPRSAAMMIEVGIRMDDVDLIETGLDAFSWLDPEHQPTQDEIEEAEELDEERRVPARAVADAATALALGGRLEQSDQLIRWAHDRTMVGLKRAVLADRHRAIALVNEQPRSLWDARGEVPWPVDACVSAGRAALAGEGEWSVVTASGPDAVCHHQGLHQLWRDLSEVPPS